MRFLFGALALIALAAAAPMFVRLEYFYFAGFVVLQFIVLATAWNILGGFAGYVNFGTGAFFAVGAYSAVALYKWVALPLGLQILAGMGSMSGTLVAGLILGVAESLVLASLGTSWAPAVAFGILLVVLGVRPAGLFGR